VRADRPGVRERQGAASRRRRRRRCAAEAGSRATNPPGARRRAPKTRPVPGGCVRTRGAGIHRGPPGPATRNRAARSRRVRARQPAAGRPDRCRRRAATARGDAEIPVRRPATVPRPCGEPPARPLKAPGGTRYNPLPAREVPECAQAEETPPDRGAAVFENSTACAPIGHGPAPRPLIDASRFVNADGTTQCRTAPEQTSSMASGTGPCVRPSPREMPDNSLRAVLHGEFDPGSGRTLAACLTHASGATNQASAWGRAANG
jgi:hypothetical protein